MATSTRKTSKTRSKPASSATKVPPAAAAAARRGAGKGGPAVSKEALASPAVTVVEDKPVVSGPVLKKPDFIDAVVARSGAKKKDVKPILEAAMALLGEALEEGREVSFPELGKLKVNREKELSGAKVIVCKLRRSRTAGSAGPQPLAKAAE